MTPEDSSTSELTGWGRTTHRQTQCGGRPPTAGALLKDIIEQTLPLGWMLPVVPGTERITVGGAIGCDVHGKNHPGAGSFGQHVLWLARCVQMGP